MIKKLGIKRDASIDFPLVVTLLLLLSFGLLMVTSASWPEGIRMFNDGYHYFKLQLINIALGLVLMFITYKFPLKFYRNFSYLAFLLSFALVMLLYTSLGIDKSGSVRWIRLPIINRDFMPSDFIKFTSIFATARFLADNHKNIHKIKIFIIFLIILAMTVVPIVTKDFSTAIVMGFTLASMLFIGGMKLYQFITLCLLAFIGFRLFLLNYPYRLERLVSFRNPFDDISDTDFQLAHSLYAFGIGGFLGVGVFQSRLKYTYIPEAHNDFIFAIIGEEFGFIGALLVIFAFIVFIYRGLVISANAKNLYEKYLAAGITISIGIQAFFNMGVAIGILPTTGITLPFLSYGGTSLIITLAAVGVLLRISKKEKSK